MSPSSGAQVVAFPEAEVSLLDAYLRGLPSSGTRKTYETAIKSFDRFMGARNLVTASRRDIESFRAHLEELGRAPSTVGKVMSALSGYYDFAVDESVIPRSPAARARRPKVSKTSPRRALSVSEVQALLRVPDRTTLLGLRDHALLQVLAVQALRVSEALGLRVEDLDEEGGHKVATVQGKGGTVIRVPVAAPTWAAIQEWISAAGIIDGPIFVPVLKGGRVQVGRAMSSQAAWKRVRYIAKAAGMARNVHPHLFRHTAATTALDLGVPLRDVQDHLRHADPRTTRRYDSHRLSLRNPAPHVLAGRLLDGG